MTNQEPRIGIMFGPQCSGKTTLANKLLGDMEYISLGLEVRKSTIDNDITRRARELIKNAEEWPADLGMKFIARSLCDAVEERKNILLDGYPRHIGEWTVLRDFLEANKLPQVTSIIEVTADKQTLWSRYRKRHDRNEGTDFFELRYEQYVNFREALRTVRTDIDLDYYTIDTT